MFPAGKIHYVWWLTPHVIFRSKSSMFHEFSWVSPPVFLGSLRPTESNFRRSKVAKAQARFDRSRARAPESKGGAMEATMRSKRPGVESSGATLCHGATVDVAASNVHHIHIDPGFQISSSILGSNVLLLLWWLSSPLLLYVYMCVYMCV